MTPHSWIRLKTKLKVCLTALYTERKKTVIMRCVDIVGCSNNKVLEYRTDKVKQHCKQRLKDYSWCTRLMWKGTDRVLQLSLDPLVGLCVSESTLWTISWFTLTFLFIPTWFSQSLGLKKKAMSDHSMTIMSMYSLQCKILLFL